MRIIGLSGTNGSGKDTFGHILEKEYGWKFISLTDILRDIAKERGQSTDREVLRSISAELREKHGLGIMIDLAVEACEKLEGNYNGLVTASLRNKGEADRIHALDGKVIWIDADPKVRYERISSRQRHDDQVSFEEFLSHEAIEMSQGKTEFELNTVDVKDRSDYEIENSKSEENFRLEVAKIIKNL